MKMCVSVAGLKTRGLYASQKFWVLTIPAFNAAKKAEGTLLRESKGGLGAYAYCLEVKAPYVGLHKITNTCKSYESEVIPTWDGALLKWEREARVDQKRCLRQHDPTQYDPQPSPEHYLWFMQASLTAGSC